MLATPAGLLVPVCLTPDGVKHTRSSLRSDLSDDDMPQLDYVGSPVAEPSRADCEGTGAPVSEPMISMYVYMYMYMYMCVYYI